MEKQDIKRVAEIMAELETLGVGVKLDGKNVDKSDVNVVGEGISKQYQGNEGMVIEIADSGKGFAIYKDYAKDKSGKFKRLSR